MASGKAVRAKALDLLDWLFDKVAFITGIGLRREEHGTHPLRRIKASIIYKATGNLRPAQIHLRHTKIDNTVRYHGIDLEDALTLAEGTEI